MRINGIELSGKIANFEKVYDEEHHWWEGHFELKDVYLSDLPVECFLRLGSDEPMFKNGQEVIIAGHLCIHDSEICGKYFNVMVCEITAVKTRWEA